MKDDRHSHHRDARHEGDELPDVSYIHNPDTLHEETDVPVKPIAAFIIVLAISTVAVAGLMGGLFKVFENMAREEDKANQAPFADERRNMAPPEPRLQLIPSHNIHPIEEYKQMAAQQQQDLTTYGWVDQSKGIVRIPIEEAKRRLLQGGLPSAPSVPQNGTPTSGPGQTHETRPQGETEQQFPSDASGGRMPERRRQ